MRDAALTPYERHPWSQVLAVVLMSLIALVARVSYAQSTQRPPPSPAPSVLYAALLDPAARPALERELGEVEQTIARISAGPSDTSDVERISLAQSFGRLMAIELQLGQLEAASRTGREAIERYGALLRAGRPEFLPDLADTLGNLGGVYRWLRQPDDAQAAYREARETLRKIAEPTTIARTAGLSRRLAIDAAVAHQERGDYGASLTEIRAAIAECRAALATSSAARPDLMKALRILAVALYAQEQEPEGIKALQEAVDHGRRLAHEFPKAYTEDLGAALFDLASLLEHAGRREQAQRAARDSVQVLSSTSPERQRASGYLERSQQLSADLDAHSWSSSVGTDKIFAAAVLFVLWFVYRSVRSARRPSRG